MGRSEKEKRHKYSQPKDLGRDLQSENVARTNNDAATETGHSYHRCSDRRVHANTRTFLLDILCITLTGTQAQNRGLQISNN